MRYTSEIKSRDFSDALGLDKKRVATLHNIIAKAYDRNWHPLGPNVDQINAFVAPYITSQEEAFYVATTILSDVFGAITSKK